MLSGKQLADALKATGTGDAKLAICAKATQADTAIDALKQANYFNTVRKAEAIVANDLADNQPKPEKPQQPAKPAETKQDTKEEPKPFTGDDKPKSGK